MSLKRHLKPFVPPIVLGLLRGAPPVRFTGSYDSWHAASSDATGYDGDEILRRVLAATRKVVAGEAVYERDSMVFDRIEYSWPLLASLLQVALERQSLRVIDFGGSLGSTWRQNRRYLHRLAVPLAWNVVEQEHFVALGREEFSSEPLRFHRTIEEAGREGVDVVLFASSLCYIENPARVVQEAEAVRAPYLIIDRLPILPGATDRIAVQHVGEPIYPASYPVRMFGEQNLLKGLLSAWTLIEAWDCDLQPDTTSKCRGYFLEKR